MLFHTQAFLLAFLPVTLAGYYALAARPQARRWWLILASLVFYGYWDWRLVPLLVGSVAGNWLLAHNAGRLGLSTAVAAGVALNLAVLGFFKYADFVVFSVSAPFGLAHDPFGIVLPLGISFFTFQQISYLVDLKRGTAPRYPFADYTLWVTLFPHLIAGPIIRHNEIIGQFALEPRRPGLAERVARGAVLFTIGLGKKVLLADPLGALVAPVYQAAAAGNAVALGDAWVAALGFSLQIFFDFAAYSDMAIGLGRALGLVLPLNFEAPYRAASIREFWRRWHMTLSRFLRDYLYIPLGGNRQGAMARAAATLVTMLLGGLWHGAGWTFVAWGGLHGVALATAQLWPRTGIRIPTALGWLLTMLVVATGFVLFRATSFAAAADIIAGMAGLNGVAAPAAGRGAWIVGLAALVATLGPTAHGFALERMRPRAWIAAGCALAFVYLLLQVGGGRNTEFIYFQF